MQQKQYISTIVKRSKRKKLVERKELSIEKLVLIQYQ